MAAVRGLFIGGHLGLAVREQKSLGVGLNRIGLLLKESMLGYSSADAGFSRLHLALQHALTGTGYQLVRTPEQTMAVVHVDHVQHSAGSASTAAPGVERPGDP